MSKIRFVVWCGLLAVSLPIFGQNPVVIRKHYGTAALADFGKQVAGLGDLDGDGFEDYGVASPLATTAAGNGAGQVRVYSGCEGVLLYVLDGTVAGGQFGRAMCPAGDFDGDGDDDFAVGWNDSNNNYSGGVRFFDGHTGTVLRTVTGAGGLGMSLCFFGDQDGDGRHEVAAGEPRFNGTAGLECGRVRVFERATLGVSTLLSREGAQAGELFGWQVARLGRDLDGDGTSEIVASAPFFTTALSSQSGRVRLILSNAATFGLTVTGGILGNDRLGLVVAAGRDFDGDGFADFAATQQDGTVRVYGATSTASVFSVTGNFTQDGFGTSLAFIDDISSDGRAELVIGETGNDAQANSTEAETFDVQDLLRR
ncbi:MAG: hypothetical protein KDB18_11690 [Salinibacterium sp.]|nr:hypothetical protein [Salinibacterium sp.]